MSLGTFLVIMKLDLHAPINKEWSPVETIRELEKDPTTKQRSERKTRLKMLWSATQHEAENRETRNSPDTDCTPDSKPQADILVFYHSLSLGRLYSSGSISFLLLSSGSRCWLLFAL